MRLTKNWRQKEWVSSVFRITVIYIYNRSKCINVVKYSAGEGEKNNISNQSKYCTKWLSYFFSFFKRCEQSEISKKKNDKRGIRETCFRGEWWEKMENREMGIRHKKVPCHARRLGLHCLFAKRRKVFERNTWFQWRRFVPIVGRIDERSVWGIWPLPLHFFFYKNV